MKRISALIILLVACSLNISAQEKKPINFEHIFDGTFSPSNVQNVRWMNDGRFYTSSRGQQVVRFNIIDGSEEVLFDGSEFVSDAMPSGFRLQGYELSADEKKLFMRTNVEQIWRRSTREDFYVYDIASKSLSKLTSTEGKQQFAELSPKGNRAAFVRDNNLFWIDLASGMETRITDDGEFNKIINGAADWVYEEEFGFAKAWFWSPDGNKIAFYRFDEERVKEFFMTEWGGLYPGLTRFKYPKAGEENAIVSIHVYDLETGQIISMDVGEEEDQYIPRINWTNSSNTLAIRRMNRLQNQQDLLFADVSTGETRIIMTEKSEGWLDVHDDLVFLKNGKQFLYTSEKDGYNHVYLYDMDGKELNQVTKGEWEVTNVVGFNERRHTLYFVSTEVSPLQRHLYQIRVDGKRKKQLSKGEGWHNINMSRDYKYYIDTYSNFNKPPVVTLHRSNGKVQRTIEDNSELAARLDEYSFGTKEFMQFEVNGTSLNGYMVKPYNFDESKKYPVLMYVYGGPGSQTVTSRFESGQRPMWHQHLANQGYIIVSVDNRGTGARGRDFKQQTYLKLGQHETEDQVDVARELAKLPFVDARRIGIWGWSYGGYMSSLGITVGNDVFSTAIAVAPVTYWGFYDTIYTERFMRTPQTNPEGYRDGSPLYKTDQLEGNYLIVHGTGDDNVHFQNAVEMIEALVKSNVQFESMYYPNRNHGIFGGNTRQHLYRLMTDFIQEHL